MPTGSDLIGELLHEHHNTLSAGHMGISKTYQRLKKSYYWKGMKRSVRDHILKCKECQANKYETLKTPGHLVPLPIPEGAWQDLSMDFIESLPPSNHKEVIFVVVDRLTKYAHFLSLPASYTIQSVVEGFQECVGKLHGFPK